METLSRFDPDAPEHTIRQRTRGVLSVVAAVGAVLVALWYRSRGPVRETYDPPSRWCVASGDGANAEADRGPRSVSPECSTADREYSIASRECSTASR